MRSQFLLRISFLLAALGAGSGGTTVLAQQEQAATVHRGTLSVDTPAVGSFQARQASHLGSQVSGRVLEVLVDVGSIVKKGQALVKLDPIFVQIELEQRKAEVDAAQARIDGSRQSIKASQAEVQIAKAAMEDADLQLQRMKSLWDKPQGEAPSIPKRMYDDALLNKAQAAGRYESAQSRLAEADGRLLEATSSLKLAEQSVRYAEKRVSETIIRAPYDAVVTNRLVDPGEPITSTPVTHILEIKDISSLELEFSLPQALYSQIKVGLPIEYEVEGVENGKGKGTIAIIYPDMDEKTRAFRCRVNVENQDLRFLPGLLVRVRIATQRPDVLLVPTGALQQIAGAWKVRLKGGDLVSVTVGIQNEREAEIQSGLKEGDQVVVQKF